MSTDQTSWTRRDFLARAAATTAAAALAARPGRAALTGGGKSLLQFKTPPMDKVRVGIIGLGMRGGGAVDRLLQIEGVEITALSDLIPDRVGRAQQKLEKAGRPKAKEFSGAEDRWKGVCDLADVDFVYTCTPWQLHTPICVQAMKGGKHAATEVPAATSLEECWDLVNTAEKTQRHCMMLENCCYGETELFALNLCRLGMLGELVHGEAAYLHDLRGLKFSESGYQGLWRLEFSKKYNGNPYPTHGLGPVAQYMGINRGDRFERLVSMSSRQRGMTLFAEQKYGKDSPQAKETYRLGDMNTTIIRTVLGRTIMVQHDTTSPRPYSRLNLISGTKGCFADYPARLALEPKAHEWIQDEKLRTEYLEKYRHPLWTKVGEIAKKVGGHGGMDFIMDWRLIECLRAGQPLDQSVYDAAAWSAVFPLSCRSVARGGESVEVPDFTRGAWETVPPLGIVGG